MQTVRPRFLINWLLTGCFLIYLMVLIGGITRLTHSGLSMVDWHMAVGSLPPMNDADWAVPFEKYKRSPEYKLLNNQFTLEDFKSIYWWEYIHRFLGRLIGMVFLLPFLWLLIRRKLEPWLLRKLLTILILGGFQGVLGWYMVKSGLIHEPRVSHFRLAAHLISAFTVFGFTWWLALDLLYPQEKQETKKADINWLAISGFGVLVLQIIYGAFVAGLKAGYFYPSFPTMNGEWIPEGIGMIKPLSKSLTEGVAGVQFIHRTLAWLVAGLAFLIWWRERKTSSSRKRKISGLLVVVVSTQFLLGVFTVLFSVPVSLGILHQTGAFVLFSVWLAFLHRKHL